MTNKNTCGLRHTLLLLILSAFSLCSNGQNKITVDLSKPSTRKESVVGFLHYGDLRTIESDVSLLRPRYWRSSIEALTANSPDARSSSINILKKNNIDVILVLSDLIREKNTKVHMWNRRFDQMNGVSALITQVYNKFGNSVIYDIWNEPNLNSFWSGNRSDFFDAFKGIYQLIRSMPGGKNAKITGPSTAGFDKNFMIQFLQYCQNNNLKLYAINWHENGDQKNGQPMMDRIDYVKNTLIPQFKSVGIQAVYIPEIIGNSEKYNPLTTLQYINNIEKSGATAACKACWGPDCGNNKMDGIIDNQGNPRSVWWAYKLYAESLDYRLYTSPSKNQLVTLAYFSNANRDTINIALGNLNNGSNTTTINLNQISSTAKFKNSNILKVDVYQIPNTEDKILLHPIKLQSISAKVKNQNTSVSLKNINNTSIYLIKVHN